MIGKDGGSEESSSIDKDEIPKNISIQVKKKIPVSENDKDLMARFLRSRGIDPRYINHEKRAAHGRTGEFQRWKKHITNNPMATAGGTTVPTREGYELSRKAQIVKDIFNKKKIDEELYDHEKEDKEVPNPKNGKKPILTDNKPSESRATLAGGKTETGQERDIIDIDPMMRNRPGSTPNNEKDDKKVIKNKNNLKSS